MHVKSYNNTPFPKKTVICDNVTNPPQRKLQ